MPGGRGGAGEGDRRDGEHSQDEEDLLRGEGVQEALAAQGHAVQEGQGLALCARYGGSHEGWEGRRRGSRASSFGLILGVGGWFRFFLAGSLARELVIWAMMTGTKERQCDPFRAGQREGERLPAKEMVADESGVSVHVPSVRVPPVRVI